MGFLLLQLTTASTGQADAPPADQSAPSSSSPPIIFRGALTLRTAPDLAANGSVLGVPAPGRFGRLTRNLAYLTCGSMFLSDSPEAQPGLAISLPIEFAGSSAAASSNSDTTLPDLLLSAALSPRR